MIILELISAIGYRDTFAITSTVDDKLQNLVTISLNVSRLYNKNSK